MYKSVFTRSQSNLILHYEEDGMRTFTIPEGEVSFCEHGAVRVADKALFSTPSQELTRMVLTTLMRIDKGSTLVAQADEDGHLEVFTTKETEKHIREVERFPETLYFVPECIADELEENPLEHLCQHINFREGLKNHIETMWELGEDWEAAYNMLQYYAPNANETIELERRLAGKDRIPTDLANLAYRQMEKEKPSRQVLSILMQAFPENERLKELASLMEETERWGISAGLEAIASGKDPVDAVYTHAAEIEAVSGPWFQNL